MKTLFEELLGNRCDLNQVLGEASKEIAKISRRKTKLSFRSVRKDGVRVTKLYNYTTTI
jgi:hypothetical protein